MRMREDLKIYTGSVTRIRANLQKFWLLRSKLSVTFAHVRNQIQKVMDNGPENPVTWALYYERGQGFRHRLYIPQSMVQIENSFSR